jgi:small GTP-binding protein
MSATYYRGALGALVVFDIANAASFQHIEEIWLPEIRNYAREDIKIVVIGNKCDLEGQRAV